MSAGEERTATGTRTAALALWVVIAVALLYGIVSTVGTVVQLFGG